MRASLRRQPYRYRGSAKHALLNRLSAPIMENLTVCDGILSNPTKEESEPHEGSFYKTICSGLKKPDTHVGENARHIEVSDDQTTPYLFS